MNVIRAHHFLFHPDDKLKNTFKCTASFLKKKKLIRRRLDVAKLRFQVPSKLTRSPFGVAKSFSKSRVQHIRFDILSMSRAASDTGTSSPLYNLSLNVRLHGLVVLLLPGLLLSGQCLVSLLIDAVRDQQTKSKKKK